jgi:hypothetical protein
MEAMNNASSSRSGITHHEWDKSAQAIAIARAAEAPTIAMRLNRLWDCTNRYTMLGKAVTSPTRSKQFHIDLDWLSVRSWKWGAKLARSATRDAARAVVAESETNLRSAETEPAKQSTSHTINGGHHTS